MTPQANPAQIGFIGLGVMGFPMAGHLAAHGHALTVFNRSPEKSRQWLTRHPGKQATQCAALAPCEVIISCVGNDDDLRATFLGPEGLLNRLRPGTLIIDHTTASAGVAEQLHEAARAARCDFLDAPVSGGQQGAIQGTLTVMCGGSETAFQRAEPILQCYSRAARLMGPAGAGQKTKMVNQIAICGLLQSLAEALCFAERAGLDRQAVIDVISKGAAQSWQMDNRHATMIAGHYEHGFAVDLMRKDLGIVLEEARRLGSSLPVTALIDQFYADVQALGGGRWDTSSLLARLRHQAGLDQPRQSEQPPSP